jgi:hypothetical protein
MMMMMLDAFDCKPNCNPMYTHALLMATAQPERQIEPAAHLLCMPVTPQK